MPAAKKIRVDKFSPALFQSNVVGTVDITLGGTGQTSSTAAINALLPSQSTNSGKYLSTDGSNISWSTVSGGSGTVTTVTSVQITDSGYNVLDDTAVSTTGGYIKITGTNFVSGASVIIGSTSAVSVGFVSSTTLNVQTPALTAGTYIVYVVNPDGTTAIRVNGLTASDLPNWQTASSLGEYSVDAPLSIQFAATEATSYVLQAGSSLPPGLSLTSGGLLSGTVTGLSVDTLYSFTVVAIDPQSQDSPRTFTITIAVTDPYFIYNAILLRADAAAQSFSTDASTNNFYATITGDVKGSEFTPYLTGWSNYFDGSGDWLTSTIPSTSIGTNSFTVECWLYPTAAYGTLTRLFLFGPLSGSGYLTFYPNSSGQIIYGPSGSSVITTTATVPLNTWTHIAISRTGGSTKVFINGVGTNAVVDNSNFTATTTFFIGSDGSNTYTGYISNFRLINGTGIYTNDFTPPTSPLTAITNTILLTCQSNRFIDNSTNNFTLTKNGDTSVSSFNPFNLYNTGTGGSAVFDTSGDWLTIQGVGSSLTFGTNPFTIEAWVYPTSSTSDGRVIWIYGNTIDIISIYVNSGTGAVGFSLRGTNLADTTLTHTNTAARIGTWTHVALVRNGTEFAGYVNGVKNSTTISASAAFNEAQAQFFTQPRIGAKSNTDGSYFPGHISNLRAVKGTAVYTANFTPPTSPLTAIANTSLLTCQYWQSSNNNTFLDSSYYNNIVTRNGNATTSTFTPFYNNYSVYFDGTGDYLTSSNLLLPSSSTSTFTLEAWVYPTVFTAGAVILGEGNPTGATFTLGMQLNSNGTFKLYWYDGASKECTSTGTLTLNNWNYIAARVSSNSIQLYVNSATPGQTGTVTLTNRSQTSSLVIGQWNSANNFTGYISNVRVSTVARTITVPTVPFTSDADTRYLICQSNRFLDNSTNNFTITPVGNSAISKFSCFTLNQYYSVAQYGGSMYFDGTGDYLTLAANSAYSFDTGDFTIECWIFYPPLSNTNGKAVLDSRPNATNGSYWLLGISSTGIMGFTTRTTGGITISDTAARPNQWVHYAATRSGSTVRLFANGQQVASGTDSSSIISSGLRVGQNAFFSTATDSYWLGYICNVSIVKGTALYTSNFTPPVTPVITPTTETSLLLTGSAAGIYDITGINTVETVANAGASTAQTKFLTASMYFDGTGDWLLIPNNASLQFGTGSFTVEFWVYITGGATNVFRAMVSKGGASTGWSIFMSNTNVWGYTDTTTNTLSTTAPVYNTWTYVTFVRSGTSAVLYINGVSVASSTSSTNFNQTEQLVVGAGRALDIPFTGHISDLRITNGIARYTSNFTPPTSPDRRR